MDANTTLILAGGLVVLVLFQRLSALSSRLDRLSGLEAKVDALLRANGIIYDPFAAVPDAVKQALDEGSYILAIKRLREATGLGLAQAKSQVDELRRRKRVAA